MREGAHQESEPSGLAISFTFVAAVLMIGSGLILTFYGAFGLFGTVGRSTDVLVHVPPKTWAVTHLLGGILLWLAGVNLFTGRSWARYVAIGCSVIAILAGIVSFEAYTVWAIGLIVLNAFILWALTMHPHDFSFD